MSKIKVKPSSIQLSQEFKKVVCDQGKKGESYEEIIKRNFIIRVKKRK